MTVRYDDDMRRAAEVSAAVGESKYLDMLNFFKVLSHSENAANTYSPSASLLQSCYFDEKTLRSAQDLYDRVYHFIHEAVVRMQSEKVNTFTAFIELPRVFNNLALDTDLSLLHLKKKMIVDARILKSLNAELVINWLKNATALYPIQTIGDGNCLVHTECCLFF
jgi:hypothetical protein